MTDDKKRVNHCSLGAILGVLAAFWVTFSAVAGSLEDYVHAEDTSYTYALVRTIPGSGYTGYVLDMKSQRWRTEAEVNRPLWQHWLTIIVPDTINSSRAMVRLAGGTNTDPSPTSVDSTLANVAVTTGTVVSELGMVLNQPLYFTDETIPRYENAVIPYSWDKYLITADSNWVVQLPMVKSVVRAMDTVQDYCSQIDGGITVSDFMVTGGSKYAWTSWLTAAADSRVFAIAPLVIDILNFQKSFRHHHAAYGSWVPALHDYEVLGIFDRFNTPEMESLTEIMDPYKYIPVLTMPKYIVCSAGDDYFLPDSSHYYFDELLGDSHLRYVPNTNHSLTGSDAFDGVWAFYAAVLQDMSLPQLSWTRINPGCIEVQTVTTPTQVNLWQATNTTSRDFRFTTTGSAWTSTPLTDAGSGLYIGQVSEPPAGWTAFFVGLIYNSGGSTPYKFTTEISVTPETLPFSCDLDFDGVIELSDIASVAACWVQTGETIADIEPPLDGDGFVGFSDFSICAGQWLIGD